MSIRDTARSAYLISNAQVTARVGRTLRRSRRSVMRNMVHLVASGDAQATGPLRAARPVHGSCLSPIQITEMGGRSNRPMLDTYVRCRKCPPCLQAKRALWSARAAQAIALHPRTWLVTLTCTPAEHFRLLNQARLAAIRSGFQPEEWSPSQEFAARWSQLGSEVTKWLKRVRDKGARFTYLQVVEAHKSGLPHVHLLMHELDALTYRSITETWRLGFCHAKLVEGTDAARYVTKYLVKSALARVRASQQYGQPTASRPRAKPVSPPASPYPVETNQPMIRIQVDDIGKPLSNE